MYKKFLPFIFIIFFQLIHAQNEFITIWKPSNQSTPNINAVVSTANQIWFPGKGTDFKVEWEEVGYPSHKDSFVMTSSSRFLIDFGNPQNPIPNQATYRVKISNGNGNFNAVRFPGTTAMGTTLWPIIADYFGDRLKILEVAQWGNIQWDTMAWAFSECSNLDVTATDTPDFSLMNDVSIMFYNCTSLIGTPVFDTWNTSTINNMSHMFAGATNFNQPVGSWDTSNVTNMNWMFHYLDYFNQPIGQWDTSNVTSMSHMLHECFAFNQDISNWDVSQVTNMVFMLGKTNFNYSLASWNLNVLALAGSMLADSGMSCESYNNTLIGWASNPVTANNVNANNFTSLNYSTQAAQIARDYLLTNKNWLLTGDTFSTECSRPNLSVDEISSLQTAIYPNPATEIIYVKNQNAENYTVFDLNGRTVLKGTIVNGQINIRTLTPGNYILQLITKGKVHSWPFIKK